MANPLLRSLFSATRKTISSYRSVQQNPYFFPRAFSTATAPSSAGVAPALDPSRLRNVAVIAHVDHGKTTLMDRLLRQCGADIPHERAMDSISLERERGITISSKVTSVVWKENELNMVDTPGHADFGGEVERVVGMVEGAVLVVDAGEGPLAQTKFVLAKALKYGLRPILLLNKVDRPSVSEERCDEVESLVFDLFANLGATEEQLDFPVLYASAKEGWASTTYTKDPPSDARNMSELLDAIVKHVPPPKANVDAPFQMLVSMMEKDSYLGRILTGRVSSGVIRVGDKIHGLRNTDSGVEKIEEGKVTKLMKKKGTGIILIDSAGAGDIISMAGLANPSIGHTVTNTEVTTALPTVELDPPTISMTFSVNDSPLAGQDGTQLTGGRIGDRLMAEAETNLAINVLPGMSESFEVQGRGELQLGILIENMRREGFELSVSPPKVMYKTEKGQKLEPLEEVTIEVNDEHVGLVMEALSHRRAEVLDMGPLPGHVGRTRMSLTCPSRGLVGYRSVFSSDTRGSGFMHRAFLTYEKFRGPLGNVRKGVLVSMARGTITAPALTSIEARGILFVPPGIETYDDLVWVKKVDILHICEPDELLDIQEVGNRMSYHMTCVAKEIIFSVEACALMLRDVDELANDVKFTMGPKGSNVVTEQSNGAPKVTKYGVTVSQRIAFTNKMINVAPGLAQVYTCQIFDPGIDITTGVFDYFHLPDADNKRGDVLVAVLEDNMNDKWTAHPTLFASADVNRLWQEWDLSLLNVLTISACNVIVVWSLAPRRSYGNTCQYDLQNTLQRLPNNIFEKSYPLREFDRQKRIQSFIYKTAELCTVGLSAGVTQAVGYGAFLGLYANLRYQMLCGIDRSLINHFDVMGVALLFSAVLRIMNVQLGERSRLAWLGVEVDPLVDSDDLLRAYNRPTEAERLVKDPKKSLPLLLVLKNSLGFLVCLISKILMFSLPRPPEVCDLEDKVEFKGGGVDMVQDEEVRVQDKGARAARLRSVPKLFEIEGGMMAGAGADGMNSWGHEMVYVSSSNRSSILYKHCIVALIWGMD